MATTNKTAKFRPGLHVKAQQAQVGVKPGIGAAKPKRTGPGAGRGGSAQSAFTKPRPMNQAQALARPLGATNGKGPKPRPASTHPKPGGSRPLPPRQPVTNYPSPGTGLGHVGATGSLLPKDPKPSPSLSATSAKPSTNGKAPKPNLVAQREEAAANAVKPGVKLVGPTRGTGPNGTWAAGDKMPGGYQFVRYMADPERPGKYVPLVRQRDGSGTAVHPEFQGGKRPGWAPDGKPADKNPGGATTVKPGEKGPGDGIFSGAWSDNSAAYDLSKGSLEGVVRDFNSTTGWSVLDKYGRKRSVSSLADALKAGYKQVTKEQILALNPAFYSKGGVYAPAPGTGGGTQPGAGQMPSWVGTLFPQIGQPGATTNPLGAGGQNWAQLFNGPSAADPEYMKDYSDALILAQQAMVDPTAQFKMLTAVDPVTGLTKYQADMQAANRLLGTNTSSAQSSAAARGVGSSGMANSNLAQIGTDYSKMATEIAGASGDPALARVQAQQQQALQSLAMQLWGAYQSSVSRAYEKLPTS